MTTIIRNIYAAKQRHSSAKLLNREKKWRPFAFCQYLPLTSLRRVQPVVVSYSIHDRPIRVKWTSEGRI